MRGCYPRGQTADWCGWGRGGGARPQSREFVKGLECHVKGFGLDLVTPACLPHHTCAWAKQSTRQMGSSGTKAAFTTWSSRGLHWRLLGARVPEAGWHPGSLREAGLQAGPPAHALLVRTGMQGGLRAVSDVSVAVAWREPCSAPGKKFSETAEFLRLRIFLRGKVMSQGHYQSRQPRSFLS